MLDPWKSIRICALWAAPLLCGCANAVYYTQLQPSSPGSAKPRAANEVEVLAAPPTRPHRNVGLLQVEQYIFDEDMMATLRTSAAAMGCDAVTIMSVDHRRSKYHSPNVQASCVVYDDDKRSVAELGHENASVSASAPAALRRSRPAVVGALPGEMRTAPYRVAPLVVRLEPGQRVSASADGSNGWRQIVLPDGRAGYVEDNAIRFE